MNTMTVFPAGPTLDPAIIARARAVASSAVSDTRQGSGAVLGLALVGGESAIPEGGSVAGPALTVRSAANDNLSLHWALEASKPGDVIIIEIPPDSVAAIMGELVGLMATQRGIAAIIVDGPVRDASELAKGSLPVYSRRTCHVGPTKVGPGELHSDIRVGGVQVRDGDLVIADRDGITVVPAAEVEESIAGGEKIMEHEIGVRTGAVAGTLDRSWVHAAATKVVIGGDSQ
jgi:regulator of RNase E activity RraA